MKTVALMHMEFRRADTDKSVFRVYHITDYMMQHFDSMSDIADYYRLAYMCSRNSKPSDILHDWYITDLDPEKGYDENYMYPWGS